MDKAEQNKALVSRFFDNLNTGDVDAVVSAYADDGTVETMGNTLISGEYERAQLPDAIGRIFNVFPDGLSFTVRDMVAEGEKVAVEAVCAGEHVSGQSYENQYHFLFEFRDGKLRKLREYMDTEQITDVLCSGQRPPFGAD
ncbi:nuclear transport factor 2 family protein [Parahaliea mediterranea]|uniref:Nuclear transport factor 2 family protein n=1 Tax=Parahaliea mediterranea TaxID=651086 RepID=A0A939IJW9_9GAMM|nr:nuclear transport factor 2 family protein [Parahaliea mediterranea]MBN7796726.1 nuclear transport factor 2 family protein [Parahaliea mediterranea]